MMVRLVTALISLALCLTPRALAVDRPNIVFVFADDWGRFASVFAEVDGPGTPNDIVQTPNIDRVAREGVLFRNAFVSAPSCTPCRSALLSGQHFWRTGRGAILRGAVWDGSQPSWPLLLLEAGYHIGETSKVWSPGTPNDAPFGAGNFAFEKAGGKFNQFSQNVTQAVAMNSPLADAKQQLLDQVRGNFDAFLAARTDAKPFCYWFGPTNVHRKWIKGSGNALWGIKPDELTGRLPPFLPDVPEVREDFADYLGEVQAYDSMLGTLLTRLEETGELERTVIVVSGDHGPPGFPHGKCNLYDFGTRVTLAIRVGKNVRLTNTAGEPEASAPGDPAVKLDSRLRGNDGGGRENDGGVRVVDDLVTLPDLAPTLLELAGIAVPEQMTGRSLTGILASSESGQIEPDRSQVFIGRERHVENARADFMPYPQRAIRTHEFLYIINFEPDRWPLGDPYRLDGSGDPTWDELANETRVTHADDDAGPTKAWLIQHRMDPQWSSFYSATYNKRPREELYDLRSDPQQLINVASDAAYATDRAELEGRLMTELHRTGDPRVVDGGRFFETPPMSGPVAAEKQDKRSR